MSAKPEDSALSSAPPADGDKHRGLLAFVALAFGGIGLILLFFVQIPEGNKEAVMLALGLVLGWGGTVIAYEFGSSPSGRKAADAGIRNEGGR
jgi:hypothetical protein